MSTSSAQCAWTAAANVPWITIDGGHTGNGPGTVRFSVTSTAGLSRIGTLTIAGILVTVTQSPGCSYTLEPSTYTAPHSGGTGAIAVRTDPGCPWSSVTTADWITILGASSGNGPDEVRFTIAPSTGPSRSATIRIADQVATISQRHTCAFSVTPTSVGVGPQGGAASAQIDTAAGCGWTASANDSWIAVTSGAIGSGGGRVDFTMAPNPGPARTGTLTVAGRTLVVAQEDGCTISSSPQSVSVPAAGASATGMVSAASGCTWSASSEAAWITITGPSTGIASGQVRFTVAPNPGPAREGLLRIGSGALAVQQESGCTYAVAPLDQNVAAMGQVSAVSISTAAGCPWTVTSNAEWLAVPVSSGSGPAQVQFAAAPNTGPVRTGALVAADRLVTVQQASPCSWVFAPPAHTFDASGGGGSILVVVTGACTWNAVTTTEWITITAGASGAGNGLVQFTVPPNGGPARSGILRIGGHDYLVTQRSP